MKRDTLLLIIGVALITGCSSCSCHSDVPTEDSTATDETSTISSETSTPTGTVEDTNTTSESNTNTGDTTSDAKWVWEDLPQGEDCGEGCRQISFSEGVRSEQWDVSDSFLVYNGTGSVDTTGSQEHLLRIVDTSTLKHLAIPNVHPEFDTNAYGTGLPTVYDGIIYYAWEERGRNANYGYIDMVSANIADHKQSVIKRIVNVDTEYGGIKWAELDAGSYGLATQGGCGDPTTYNLCYFTYTDPMNPRELVPDYGSHNTFFEGKIVYYTGDYDIHLYDLATNKVVKITDDQHETSQLMARMHGKKVVYQDLRFGTGDGMGNWNHSAVFLYDLDTKETQQVSGGDWIACYPDVHNDVVVWLDYRACTNPNDINQFRCAQVWGKNIKTGVEKQISAIARPKDFVRVWDNRVYVHMMRQDPKFDGIFMFDLSVDLK
jgi:hypothetical protein